METQKVAAAAETVAALPETPAGPALAHCAVLGDRRAAGGDLGEGAVGARYDAAGDRS